MNFIMVLSSVCFALPAINVRRKIDTKIQETYELQKTGVKIIIFQYEKLCRV